MSEKEIELMMDELNADIEYQYRKWQEEQEWMHMLEQENMDNDIVF